MGNALGTNVTAPKEHLRCEIRINVSEHCEQSGIGE